MTSSPSLSRLLFAVPCAIFLAAGGARADAIGPGPPGCPPGSRPDSSHSGEWCAPTTCAADRPCDEGMRCARASLCVEVVEMTSGGRQRGDGPPPKHPVPQASGTCTSNADCAAPATCVTTDRCLSASPAPAPAPAPVPATVPTSPPPPSTASAPGAAPAAPTASSCAAAPVGEGLVVVVLGLLALPMVRRRRRVWATTSAHRRC